MDSINLIVLTGYLSHCINMFINRSSAKWMSFIFLQNVKCSRDGMSPLDWFPNRVPGKRFEEQQIPLQHLLFRVVRFFESDL